MIIVTGANGFIGSALVWELNKRGHDNLVCVDSTDLKSRPQLLAPLKYQSFFHHLELLDWLKTSEAKKVSAVFHMGACSSTTETDVEFLKRNNTEYSQELFLFCSQLQIPYIYASSGAVYGDGSLGFDDATPTEKFKPLNPYGWSKANFDRWVEEQPSKEFPWYGLRFFNVYGPNEYFKGDMASVVYKAFHQISETGKLRLFKSHHPDYRDGEQMRDFVYVKDIVFWMAELLERRQVKSGIYNMGSGKARTWLDLARSVFANMNRPLNIEWIEVPENIRQQYQYFTEAKMSRWLEQKLPPPQWTLEAGVGDYIKNYLLSESPYLS